MVSEIRQPEQEQDQQQEQPQAEAEAEAEAQGQAQVEAQAEAPVRTEEQSQGEAPAEPPAPAEEIADSAAPVNAPEPREAQPSIQEAIAAPVAPVQASAQAPAQAPAASAPSPARSMAAAPRTTANASAAEKVESISPEVWVPEFGIFDMVYLEPDRRYQGRVYRLSQEQVKSLSETIGFTARFDHPNIRAAYVDIIKTEGHITFEIDRNTKPVELNLRYSRDRWSGSEAASKGGADAMRPWIKSAYDCRFLPEKVAQVVATQLRMDPEKISNFYIRLNLKEKTAGLIAEDKHIDLFPTQPFQVFALPEGHVATIPSVEVVGQEESGQPRPAERVIVQEVGPKYATYSRSEIDRMLKMQAENITTVLAGKMSGQQRSFLEAVEAQEKAFAKITERYVIQFEEARIKLEDHTKSMHESAQTELNRLNADLGKELTEFRAHVNKNILPISRAIEDKVKEIQVAAAKPVARKENVQSIIIGTGIALLIAISASTAFIYASVSQLSELSDLKTKIDKVLEKASK